MQIGLQGSNVLGRIENSLGQAWIDLEQRGEAASL